MTDSTQRFGDRALAYHRFRPRYPDALGKWLGALGISEGTGVADLGAGTGILTQTLRALGATVFLVEPNREMLAIAREAFAADPRVRFVDGRAEATSLSDQSVDWIAAGQSFHWFDAEATRQECQRILRPGGCGLLAWIDRAAESDPVMAAFEALLARWSTDYGNTTYRARNLEYEALRFFRGPVESAAFETAQRLDEDGFVGRFASSSYMPAPDDERFPAARGDALELFAEHCDGGGLITLRYRTVAFVGTLVPAE